jgi:hypothetical protein
VAARRRIGLFLAITGLLILGASGYLARGDAARRAEIRAEQAALADSATRVHDELVKTSLKMRAFQSSLSSMPDTVRRFGGREVMDIGQGYNKTIRKLEFKERDIKIEIAALEREVERDRQRARGTALPVAVAGACATVAGGILIIASRRRVGA